MSRYRTLVEHHKKNQDNLRYYDLLRHAVSAQRDMKETNQLQFRSAYWRIYDTDTMPCHYCRSSIVLIMSVPKHYCTEC